MVGWFVFLKGMFCPGHKFDFTEAVAGGEVESARSGNRREHASQLELFMEILRNGAFLGSFLNWAI